MQSKIKQQEPAYRLFSKKSTLIESYMLLTKLNDGSIADWFEPSLIMDIKYPGTRSINRKNAIAPMAVI